MSSLSSEASLIVAAFHLLAVRAVTGAARAADIESGDVITPAGIVEQPQRRFLDSDTFTLSGATDHEMATDRRNGRFSPPNETQEISRAEPKLIARPERYATCCDPCHAPPIPNPASYKTASPIEPPWKVLPWMDRYARSIAALEQVKRVRIFTDNASNGFADRGGILNVVI